MDVGDAGAAAAAVFRIVGDGEEADAGFQRALGLNLVVEIVDNGDVAGG